ncbi:MAG: response regulator transcription factor [Candidatus Eremiobacteraeota bacterium]|nr:response regulator transcription factor [Candidatus Eremiobacteraeota bacterium]
MNTRLVIADDQSAYRVGLRALLSTLRGIEIVGEAADGCEAISICSRVRPDVALMDIRMPVMDGIAATRELSKSLPATRILVLTTFDDDELVRAAVAAGAAGYVLKDTPADDLAAIIGITRRGYSTFGPGLVCDVDDSTPSAQPARAHLGAMTERERDVLRELAIGASNKRIATTLGISDGTVRNYMTSILSQLGLSSRTEAALAARSIFERRSATPESES